MKKTALFFLSFLLMAFVSAQEPKNPILDHPDMAPHYLLPENHKLKPILDKIFSSKTVLNNQKSLDKAGFITLYKQSSGMRVLEHPKLKGYLIKAYLNDEKRRSGKNCRWLFDRCKGAENIRNLISENKLKYFTVPDKFIYLLPVEPDPEFERQLAVLLVTDMKLVTREESVEAWGTKITKAHLKELYCILSHGFASCYFVNNIPYTKNGTFSCIDTAYPHRNFDLSRHGRHCFSEEMRAYWDELVRKGKRVK